MYVTTTTVIANYVKAKTIQKEEFIMSAVSHLELKLQRYALGVLRIVLGIIFVAHGAQKLFQFGLSGTAGFMAQAGIPFATASAILVISAELLGGLALVAGLTTRLAGVPLAATMVVAMLVVHLPGGFFLPQGFEYTLALLAGLAALIVGGGGAWALDNIVWSSGDPAVAALAARRSEATDREALRSAA